MASLEDRLKSLRTKMVTNLTTRGVTADETMTLNVLSDKILSCTPIPTNILLEIDKTELNTSTDPTATLTATVTDISGNAVQGVEVEFFANNSSLSPSITSLGSGITNSNGKVTYSLTPSVNCYYYIQAKMVLSTGIESVSNEVYITRGIRTKINIEISGNYATVSVVKMDGSNISINTYCFFYINLNSLSSSLNNSTNMGFYINNAKYIFKFLGNSTYAPCFASYGI